MNYLLIFVLVLLSAFFSSSETAFASASAVRLRKNAEENMKNAKTALFISEHYERALSSILVGNNLVNIAASSVATVIFVSYFGNAGASYSTVVMTLIILIFGEIVPKVLAKEHADGLVYKIAIPLRICMFITFPVVWVVNAFVSLLSRLWGGSKKQNAVTEDELSSLIEMVEDEGVIDEEQGELLQSAIDFSDISAQEILTPRVDLVAIDIDDDREKILEIIAKSRYSRIPVYEDTIDNIIGVLYLNHFYKKALETRDFDLRELLIDVCFIHRSLKLPAVLRELRRQKTHIAVVADEYGGTMGIVTMEDVLEQLVGEIWDETDEVTAEIVKTSDNSYDVDGDMSIYDFFDEIGLDEDDFEGDFTTVGGWATEMCGDFPEKGFSFTYKNVTVTVTQTDELRVLRLSAVVAPSEEEE